MSVAPLASATHLERVKTYFLNLQDRLCLDLGAFEPNPQDIFKEDLWQHSEQGGGRSRILEGGQTFERAGINFSCVQGRALPSFATDKRPELNGYAFVATGVSLVIHPNNPYVPTTHFNVRFFQATHGEHSVWWFGGGFDLTPYYPVLEDCITWHKEAEQACLPFGSDVYPKFKKWCDDYFFIKHRNEARGIGGVFFDDLNQWPFETCFAFIQSISEHFIRAYHPIVSKRMNTPYGERERNFQLYRRGRYIEFNLIYDRGTLFGLHSGGRTESIFMSLPPLTHFKYNWHPEPNSPEAELYTHYLKARDWV